MESANKFQDLGQALTSLQRERQSLINLMSKYDNESLNRSPGTGVWSPLEVLHHIIISEEGSLKYVQKKLSFDPELPKTNFISNVRYGILLGAIYSPIRFSAPASVVPRSESFEFLALERHWQEVATDLGNYLEQLDPRWFDYQVYKHPIAGRLSILQMLGFLRNHLLRHKKQIVSRLPSAT